MSVLWLVAQSVRDVLIVLVPVPRNESSATHLLTEGDKHKHVILHKDNRLFALFFFFFFSFSHSCRKLVMSGNYFKKNYTVKGLFSSCLVGSLFDCL